MMPKELDYDVWAQEHEDEAERISQRIKELKELAAVSTDTERKKLEGRISSLKEARDQLNAKAKVLRNWGKPT